MLAKVKSFSVGSCCQSYSNNKKINQQMFHQPQVKDNVAFGHKGDFFKLLAKEEVLVVPFTTIHIDSGLSITSKTFDLKLANISKDKIKQLDDLLKTGKAQIHLYIRDGYKQNRDFNMTEYVKVEIDGKEVTAAHELRSNMILPDEHTSLYRENNEILGAAYEKHDDLYKNLSDINDGKFKRSWYMDPLLRRYANTLDRIRQIVDESYNNYIRSLLLDAANVYPFLKELSPEDAQKVGELFDKGYHFERHGSNSVCSVIPDSVMIRRNTKAVVAPTGKEALLSAINELLPKQ